MNKDEVGDNKIRILFLLSRFLDGGIDMVLVDYLRHLIGNPAYQLTLAIGVSMNELEVFAKEIPPQVSVVHLVEADWLTKWRRQKIVNRHLPLVAKVCDEVCLSPLRRMIISRGLRRLSAEHDVVIDFDCCFYSYLKGIHIPKIAWFHFSFNQALRQNRSRTLRIGKCLEHYDRVVCISESMREEGDRLFPRLANKWCVIYNAKNREAIQVRASQPVDDERIHLPYMLAVERLEESQKDLSTLLQAWQLFKQQYHHTELLYLLGKGNSEAQLRQLASDLGIADSVVFLGFKANPYPWILNSRMLIHSAKFEGLPTVLTEGLMLDKLMVATDCPTGPREILDGGKAGLLVPVGDAQAMAEAMHRLMTDTALQESIRHGVAQQQQTFTFETTERQFQELVRQVRSR